MSQVSPLQKTFEQGVAQHRAGRLPEAERLYRKVLEREPEHETAMFLVAAISIETGRSAPAVDLLLRLVERHPENAVYHSNLGEAYRRLERYEEAAAALVRAVTLQPDLAQAHFNLGVVTRQLGELDSAILAFERAADLMPEKAQLQYGLARALRDRGELERALGHFQCAVVQSPKSPEMLVDYAITLRKLRRFETALGWLERTIELVPDYAVAHHEHGANLVELHRFDEAVKSAEKALSLEPQLDGGHCGLGSALLETGKLGEAIAAYRRAVALDPKDCTAHSNLIFLLPFHADSTAQTILAETRRWTELHATPLKSQVRAHDNDRDPGRRLRIGYVSSNFTAHCQSLFTLPLLAQHDRQGFEIFAYSGVARPDQVTEQLRAQFDNWRDISRLEPIAIAERVRADKIDVLVDLTMHMAVSQLRVFACKPAPVQIAWLAYPGTTGLPAMDYRITDRFLDPPELAEPYAEAPLSLPDTFWCYHPLATEPEVSALPALANGHVTFGCLNAFWKLNEATWRLWAQVLAQVPCSRLLMLAPEGSARARVRSTFESAGVPAERVELVARQGRPEYLKTYQRIDICLDSLPYNGHTTSLDAFWMGVPVVTLVGKTVVGRAGLCQATNLELPQLIADSPAEFVHAAAHLTGDLPALAELRSVLRERMERSPLMDAARFARNLEATYRAAWRAWCEKQEPGPARDETPTPSTDS